LDQLSELIEFYTDIITYAPNNTTRYTECRLLVDLEEEVGFQHWMGKRKQRAALRYIDDRAWDRFRDTQPAADRSNFARGVDLDTGKLTLIFVAAVHDAAPVFREVTGLPLGKQAMASPSITPRAE
jgi:hypothetical protein